MPQTITPREVYDAYPHSDLLPIRPPREGETYAEYRNVAIDAHDGLFEFLLAELCEEEDIPLTDLAGRMTTAMNDVASMLDLVERKADETDATPVASAQEENPGPPGGEGGAGDVPGDDAAGPALGG